MPLSVVLVPGSVEDSTMNQASSNATPAVCLPPDRGREAWKTMERGERAVGERAAGASVETLYYFPVR